MFLLLDNTSYPHRKNVSITDVVGNHRSLLLTQKKFRK